MYDRIISKNLLGIIGVLFVLSCEREKTENTSSLPVISQQVSKVWVADLGDGMYQNPIIHADYSDPDVCAVGDDFYMTASSFGCTPGLPILHSKDLVNWQIVNYALKEIEPKDFYQYPQHGKGVWAPSIRHHDGMYYIYWDFNDPAIPNAPRDASAACVVASALLELHAYLPSEKGIVYYDAAIKMLQNLSSPKYQSGESKPAFLLHSTGHKPAGSEIDASIIYADYYYIEALNRLKKMQ